MCCFLIFFVVFADFDKMFSDFHRFFKKCRKTLQVFEITRWKFAFHHDYTVNDLISDLTFTDAPHLCLPRVRVQEGLHCIAELLEKGPLLGEDRGEDRLERGRDLPSLRKGSNLEKTLKQISSLRREFPAPSVGRWTTAASSSTRCEESREDMWMSSVD